MQVYKFGGASVKDAPSVKNVATILRANPSNDKVVVISAMGKSTNELEKVVNLYTAGDQSWQTVLEDLHKKHLVIINELFDELITVLFGIVVLVAFFDLPAAVPPLPAPVPPKEPKKAKHKTNTQRTRALIFLKILYLSDYNLFLLGYKNLFLEDFYF